MTDLIARLEALTGPDREVDDLIHEAVIGRMYTGGHDPRILDVSIEYTASLDAALSLVPDKLKKFMCFIRARDGAILAQIGNGAIQDAYDGRGCNEATALTAASLKARGIK